MRRSNGLLGDWARLTLSLRGAAVRYGLAALMVVSAMLVVLGKADVKLYAVVTSKAGDVAAPALALLKEPLAIVRDIANATGSMLALRQENARLREENRRLLVWQAEAAKLSVENDALRHALKMPSHPEAPVWLTARVVADPGGPFVNTALIDAGADSGVRDGMAVLDDHGLVGRIVEVGSGSARVLMITDLNSRIPVMIDRSRDEAIMEGNNGRFPELRFLPMNPRYQVGDQVLTSGRDGILPPGLLVGRISAIRDQHVVVTPYVDWDRLDYVAVLERQRMPTPDQAPEDTSGDHAANEAAAAQVGGARTQPQRPQASRH